MMKRKTGSHLRLKTTLGDLLYDALALQMPIVQTALLFNNERYYRITDYDESIYNRLRGTLELIIHGSYRINLANAAHHHPVLQAELRACQRLGVTKYVIHPGVLSVNQSRQAGLESVVLVLEKISKIFPAIIFILENTPHGLPLIGANFCDLSFIKERFAYPDRLHYCFDTGHAFAAGYDICSEQGRALLINDLKATSIADSMSLIHLNDIVNDCGKNIDVHALPGNGSIGAESLQILLATNHFSSVSIIIEPPDIPLEQLKTTLERVTMW